jgi:5-methyltetrahydropteroyltriglutamate--homocysteine methyltransferase
MADGYRADHVGSFLRPAELLQARSDQAAGRISKEQLAAVEDKAIQQVLEMEKDAGVSVYSDGEYRRSGWGGNFAPAVDGYVTGERKVNLEWHGPPGAQRPAGAMMAAQARVIGEKLVKKQRMAEVDSKFLKQHAPGPFKITMPAASYICARGYFPGESDKAYPTRRQALADISKIIRSEIEALIAEGVPYIQLDNPHYPDYVDDQMRQQWEALGMDPDQMVIEDVEADNACFEGLNRNSVTIAMHLCRGNSRSGWHTSGGYNRISSQVFGGLNIDRWLLEYETPRSGSFEPLQYVQKGKQVVLGLISSKDPTLESQDELLQRIDEASKYVPVANLALSPQCGFASVVEGNLLTWDEQRKKLELVVDTARKVWG